MSEDGGLRAVAEVLDSAEEVTDEPGSPEVPPAQPVVAVVRLPEDCPVIPLGVRGDTYFYLDALKQMREVKDKDHSKLRVESLYGVYSDLLPAIYPRFNDRGEPTGGWKNEEASRDLMRAASAQGVWSPFDKVREAGAWTGREAQLIIHCGTRIWIGPPPGKRGRGQWMDPGLIEGRVYPSAPAMQRPAEKAQKGGEDGPAYELLTVLNSWNWRRGETDAVLLLGWIGAAMMGGALKWRPLAWITGGKHTGKSTLQDVVKHVLGENGLVNSGDATAAGVWQALGYASIPVALDEQESEEDNRKINAMVKLARNAASGALILRGGSDHNGASFAAQCCFLFSSILLPPLLGQDRSRMAILELGKLGSTNPPKMSPERLDKMGAALRRRMIDGWARWPQTLEAYRQALADHGHVGRGADVFGTLLAAADLLLWDAVPSAANLRAWGEKLAAAELAELEGDVADEHHCLNHLLTFTIDPHRSGARRTVGQWIMEAAQEAPYEVDGDVALKANQALQTYGIKVTSLEGARYLAVANSHSGLAGIFAQTHWAGRSGALGVWVQALRRLPGTVVPKKALWIGATVKASLIPLELCLPAKPDATGGRPAPNKTSTPQAALPPSSSPSEFDL